MPFIFLRIRESILKCERRRNHGGGGQTFTDKINEGKFYPPKNEGN